MTKMTLQTPTDWIPLDRKDLTLIPQDVLLYIHATIRPELEAPDDAEFVALGFHSSESGTLVELPTMVSLLDACIPDFYHVVYNPKGKTISIEP